MSRRRVLSQNRHTISHVRMGALNRAHWERVSQSHVEDDFYPTERVLRGGSSLSAIERQEIGNINSAVGVHLQCGIGLDTISLQRLGACMTGIDFAQSAIAIARSIAARCDSKCSFIVADVTKRAELPSQTYDFVYCSHGVLRWIPNLAAWTRNAAALTKPGGFFYLFEINPLVYRLRNVDGTGVFLAGDYFDERPHVKMIAGTHTRSFGRGKKEEVVHANWTLGTIVTSILSAGFGVEFLHEHRSCSYSRKGLISRRVGSLWRLKLKRTPMPLAFSIRARKL